MTNRTGGALEVRAVTGAEAVGSVVLCRGGLDPRKARLMLSLAEAGDVFVGDHGLAVVIATEAGANAVVVGRA